MSTPIIIIGSGFAAYQLIKTIRRTDQNTPISVFTLDAGHDYSKPNLSHVFSKQQTSSDLILTTGSEFALQHKITLHAFTQVERVDSDKQEIVANGVVYPYSSLVFATGAKAFIPLMQGSAVSDVITLNSLSEFEASQQQLQQAQRVLLIGAGLIGTEIAMDLAQSGKDVVVVDPCDRLMSNMLPELVAHKLQKNMQDAGVVFALNTIVSELNRSGSEVCATLSSGDTHNVDCVISAAGLKANTQLANVSGLSVNQGIVVNQQLQTSVSNIYALGDCAEIDGKVMAYLQPIILSANALAQTLLGQNTEVKFSPMLVNVKTPQMPIQFAGDTVKDVSSWQIDIDEQGCCVKAYNEHKNMVGFVVTMDHMKNAFSLLRSLSC